LLHGPLDRGDEQRVDQRRVDDGWGVTDIWIAGGPDRRVDDRTTGVDDRTPARHGAAHHRPADDDDGPASASAATT